MIQFKWENILDFRQKGRSNIPLCTYISLNASWYRDCSNKGRIINVHIELAQQILRQIFSTQTFHFIWSEIHQSSLLCSHSYYAVILILQSSLLCSHPYYAANLIMQSLFCSHHYYAVILIMQPTLLCSQPYYAVIVIMQSSLLCSQSILCSHPYVIPEHMFSLLVFFNCY